MKKEYFESTDSSLHASESRDKSAGKRPRCVRAAIAASMALGLIAGLLISGRVNVNMRDNTGAVLVEAAEPASDSQGKETAADQKSRDQSKSH